MAIALVTSAEKSLNSSVTNAFSMTVEAGNDRLLTVAVVLRNSSSQTVASVTFGGQSLTKTDGAAADMTHVNGTAVRVELWKLVAPNVGTNTVTVTFSAAALSYCCAGAWTGVDQSTPLGTWAEAAGGATGTTDTATVDVSSAAGDVVVDVMGTVEFASPFQDTPVVGADQTVVEQGGFFANELEGGHSYEDGATTVTMSWSLSAPSSITFEWAIGGVPIIASTDVSDPVDSSLTVQEIRVAPLRQAPYGLDYVHREVSETAAQSRYQLPARFAASGAYPVVFRARLVEFDEEEFMTLDSVWHLPSVGEAGAMALTQLPTQDAPGASLIATTRDRIVQYPMPPGRDPALVDYPHLIRSGVNFNEIVTVKFSEWDEGQGPYTLHGVHVVLRDGVKDTDFVGVSYAWDDFNPYSKVNWQTGNDLWFTWGDVQNPKNAGHVLKLWLAIYDGSSGEPVGVRAAAVDSYVSPANEARQQTGATLTSEAS